jgi:Tfp pilus assembly protein PilO
MKRLSPAKKKQLFIVLLITAALIGAVYFLLISPQNEANAKLTRDTTDRMAELDKYKKIISQADATSKQLEDMSSQLNQAEQDIATGDVYSWTYDTIRRFKAAYHVDIPTIGQPSVGDVEMIQNFPYKQLRFSLTGTAYYQDLGKFVADFENTFPHMRLLNLSIEPNADSNGGSERLAFRVDVIALVKPNS